MLPDPLNTTGPISSHVPALVGVMAGERAESPVTLRDSVGVDVELRATPLAGAILAGAPLRSAGSRSVAVERAVLGSGTHPTRDRLPAPGAGNGPNLVACYPLCHIAKTTPTIRPIEVMR